MNLSLFQQLDLQQVGTSQKKSEREKNREKTGGGGLAFLLVYTNRKPKAPLPFPKGKALQVAKFFTLDFISVEMVYFTLFVFTFIISEKA